VGRRVAVTGATGRLGSQLVTTFAARGDEVLPLARPRFDITRRADLNTLRQWRPEVVLNAAAWTDVDGCARDPDRAELVNGTAAGMVARAAASVGALIVQVSTNEVFDGTRDQPYDETDEPRPINPYGASKLLGERLVSAATGRHLIVRTAWLFGADGDSFVSKILAASARARRAGERLLVVGDEWGNPTPVTWLARAILGLVERAAAEDTLGVYHRSGVPAVSRYEWARHILSGEEVDLVEIPHTAFVRASSPPLRAVLASVRPPFTPGGEWLPATEARVAAWRASAHASLGDSR
jgi:dTDP-4-dehydrorhamnose reductase